MTRSLFTSLASVSLLLAAGGCGDDESGSRPSDAAVADGGATSDVLAGETQVSVHTGIAVVNSDYMASSLSFLDTDGTLLKDGCLHSGTGGLSLTLALSGDVVLPSQIPPGGPVVLVDRSSSVLTWVDPATCAPLRQLAVDTGFAANPHDIVVLSGTKAYVTRAEGNSLATPTPDDFDDGDDLLIIDPSAATILGRIDLKTFAATDGKAISPKADRALLAEGRVYVSLTQIANDYQSYGTGRIVIIDPTTDQVTGFIDLPGAKNCGALTYLATERQLLIACNGAYSDGPQQADTSAIVAIDLGLSPPAVVATMPASSVGGLPFSSGSLAALSSSSVLAVTLGNVQNLPADRLWSLSVAGGLPKKVVESAEGFALGAVVADSSTGRVLVADGTMGNPAFLRTFDSADGMLTAGPTVKTNPSGKLPPRALAFY